MWFLVSMGRAAQCGRVVQSMLDCGISTHGQLIVNGTQQEAEYRSIRLPDNWTTKVLPQNIGVCGAIDTAFREYPSEDCYSLICDDEFVHSPGFDVRLIEAAGKWGVSHGNDGWRSDEWLHTFPTFGGELLRTVGWWPLPGIWHNYFDNAWQEIVYPLNLRRYCRDVKTTQLNVDVNSKGGGNAEWDDTYRIGRQHAGQDKAVFEAWKSAELPAIKERILRAMR